jgi:peptidoglycan/LPS O-acetylase OafA/YrhL
MNSKTAEIKNTERYPELDALRGLAALMVVFFHFTFKRVEPDFGFRFGATGVELFFIISGFVIFMSLTKITKSSDFIINRVSRLYPTYWVSVTFTFLLIVVYAMFGGEEFNIVRYLSNMTMFQFYMNIKNLDGSYWTMIIEMLFYIGILLLFHFKILRYLNIIGLTLTVAVAVTTFFWGEEMMVKKIIANIPLLQFIALFLAGSVFYKIYIYKEKLLENYAIIIVCLICQVSQHEYSGKSFEIINNFEYAIVLTFFFGLFTLFINNKLTFIVSKGTLFLGKISFALYLTHQYVSLWVIIPTLTNKLKMNFWLASFGIALPVTILIASFITFYLEVPLSKLMKKKLRNLNR